MFSEKLRELREQSGMKQEELAKKMYLSRPVISKWERGLQYPNVEQLKQLSRIFHISMDELMDNTDFMMMPEVQPIMETKEETNLELIIFSALLVLYFIKLLFDLTVEYWPTLIDWLMEDIVFLPVLAYATYKSYKKEVSPKVIGYMFIYSMMSFSIKRLYMNIRALIYWVVMVLTVGYGMYVSVLHCRGYFTDLFGWNEHYIYRVISYISRMLIVIGIVIESTKLKKKRIQARESVSK